MDKKLRWVLALISDGLLAALSAFGVFSSAFGFNFMADLGRLTTAPFFVTFTGLSNVLIGLVALTCFIVRLIRKDVALPSWLFVTRLAATSCISFTMLVTAAYLAPSVGEEWWRLYINSSLFNHFFTPAWAIASFMLFEERTSLKYPCCLYSMIPMAAYGIFYLIRAYTHVDASGNIDLHYDVYGLARWGLAGTIGFMFAFLALNLGIASLLYLQNCCKKPTN